MHFVIYISTHRNVSHRELVGFKALRATFDQSGTLFALRGVVEKEESKGDVGKGDKKKSAKGSTQHHRPEVEIVSDSDFPDAQKLVRLYFEHKRQDEKWIASKDAEYVTLVDDLVYNKFQKLADERVSMLFHGPQDGAAASPKKAGRRTRQTHPPL